MYTKKIIISGIAIVGIAALAVFNVNVSSKGNGLSDMSLANVDALAQSENPLCPNGCLDKSGDGCYCYIWIDSKEEANWP
jgi:hypothetical protein